MKTLPQYIEEKLVINKKFKEAKPEKKIRPSGKWYMSAAEVSNELAALPSKGNKPAKFIFHNYELYPDYDIDEWGVTDMFPYNGKTWYCTLISREKFGSLPAVEVISYDFRGEEPNDIVCVGTQWTQTNGRGVYNAKNKKYRIISITEEDKYIVFEIDDKK